MTQEAPRAFVESITKENPRIKALSNGARTAPREASLKKKGRQRKIDGHMMKVLLTVSGLAEEENIGLSIMKNGPSWSVNRDLESKFSSPAEPNTINTFALILRNGRK